MPVAHLLWEQGVVSSSLAAPTFDVFRIRKRPRRVLQRSRRCPENITQAGGRAETGSGGRGFYATRHERGRCGTPHECAPTFRGPK
jgi:hypothetical protein